MNGTCFQDPIGFVKFSISPEFVPLLMDKDLLHKIFVSLRGIKQELGELSLGVRGKLESKERLRFTFTPNGKREFVPRDEVFSLFFVYCILFPHKNK